MGRQRRKAGDHQPATAGAKGLDGFIAILGTGRERTGILMGGPGEATGTSEWRATWRVGSACAD
jgi:hypothetical protein